MSYVHTGPLVRATSSTSSVIWAEFSQPCHVTVIATPALQADTLFELAISEAQMHTVTVGSHYYAAPELIGLHPSTWYTYQIVIHTESGEHALEPASVTQCFRTFDITIPNQSHHPEATLIPPALRIAYGSCRKAGYPAIDALSAAGSWLSQHIDKRESVWPHLLLLIGDQIYADEPTPPMLAIYPQLQEGAKTFSDFADMYHYVWTCDTGIRQVLAALPTFMIFDDHEVTNNWNNVPSWREQRIQEGQEGLLVDAIVAYWVYQGWGNLQQANNQHPLLALMREGEQSQTDILEALRAYIREETVSSIERSWHYVIPTTPSIFVANARAGRTSVFSDQPEQVYESSRILGKQQMAELQQWMQQQNTIALLISSVPILLPPVIGLAEYLMGLRPFQQNRLLRGVGLQLARIQQWVTLKTSFDHWPLFTDTWQELLHLLDTQSADIVALSGDVHFSYSMSARRTIRQPKNVLYQLVSTPFQNVLSPSSRKEIELQSTMTRISYGGLSMRMLPLYKPSHQPVRSSIIWQNALAFITVQLHADGYTLRQDYMGIVDEKGMDVLASVQIKR